MPEPFADLPDALVADLIAQAIPVSEGVALNLNALWQARAGLRAAAEEASLIKSKADLDVSREPTVVGIDGSYQIHRLMAVDLCAAAAVAVEGTARPESRIWE